MMWRVRSGRVVYIGYRGRRLKWEWWYLNISCISGNRNENLYSSTRLEKKSCGVRLRTRRREEIRSIQKITLSHFYSFKEVLIWQKSKVAKSPHRTYPKNVWIQLLSKRDHQQQRCYSWNFNAKQMYRCWHKCQTAWNGIQDRDPRRLEEIKN